MEWGDVSGWIESARPSEDDMSKASSKVSDIYGILTSGSFNDELPFKITQIVKGGSFSKRTMCKEKGIEVEFIAFIKEFDCDNVENYKKSTWKYLLDLDINDNTNKNDKNSDNNKSVFKECDSNAFSISFVFDSFLRVDLFFTGEIPDPLPARHKLVYFFPAFAKLQRDFIRGKCSDDPFILDIILALKRWRSTKDWGSKYPQGPKSYLLELLSIHAVELAYDDDDAGEDIHRAALSQFFQLLNDWNSVKLFWDHPETNQHLPVVLDPTNPKNNLARAVKSETEFLLKQYASDELERMKD